MQPMNIAPAHKLSLNFTRMHKTSKLIMLGPKYRRCCHSHKGALPLLRPLKRKKR